MFNNISVYEAYQILDSCPKSKEQYKNLKPQAVQIQT